MTALLPIMMLLTLSTNAAKAQQNQVQQDTDYWTRLPNGGVSGRPWVVTLKATTPDPNGGADTVINSWSDTASPSESPPAGFETPSGNFYVDVQTVNMCTGAANEGQCYSTPNRVSFVFSCTTGGGFVVTDFNSTQNTCNIDETTTIELTANLNTFTDSYQWAWMNGDLSYWKTWTGDDGNTMLKARFKPVKSPVGFEWPESNCCTCDMPERCDITHSSSYEVRANFFIHCQGSGLTGSVFATQNTIMGAMQQTYNDDGGSTLEYRLVSSHFAPDGSLQQGSMLAVVPLTTITSLYPSLDSVESAIENVNMTRTEGQSGEQETIAVLPWNVDDHGTEGVAFDINGVTFSVPVYQTNVESAAATPKTTTVWAIQILGLAASLVAWIA